MAHKPFIALCVQAYVIQDEGAAQGACGRKVALEQGGPAAQNHKSRGASRNATHPALLFYNKIML